MSQIVINWFFSTWPHSTFLCDVLDGLTGLASHTWPHSLFNPSYSYEEISNIVGKKKNQCSSWILAIFVFAKWYNWFFFGCEYRLSLISLLRCPAKAIPSMKLKYKKWKNLQKLTYMQVWWSLFHQSLHNCIKSISVL